MAVEKKKIIIVGCGPGAEYYITPAAREAAQKADVLIVSRRLQELFPEIAAERIDSGIDVDGTLDTMAARRDAGLQVVLLATGDPGIASLAQPVVRRFGRENCEVIPGISSIQVAFAGSASTGGRPDRHGAQPRPGGIGGRPAGCGKDRHPRGTARDRSAGPPA